jgi:plasmid maintenance system antidote protein VapI
VLLTEKMETQFPHEYLNQLIDDRLSNHVSAKNHAELRRSIATKIGIHPRTLERYLTGQRDMAGSTVLGLIDALEMSSQEINKFIQFYRQSKNTKKPVTRRPIRKATTVRKQAQK